MGGCCSPTDIAGSSGTLSDIAGSTSSESDVVGSQGLLTLQSWSRECLCLEEGVIFDLAIVASDSLVLVDYLGLAGETDPIGLSDALDWSFTKIESDAVTLSEARALTLALGEKNEALHFADSRAWTLSDVTAETLHVAEAAIKSITDVTSETLGLSEARALSFTEGLKTDSITLSETKTRTSTSVRSESISLSEAKAVTVSDVGGETLTTADRIRQGYGDLGYGKNPAGYGGN